MIKYIKITKYTAGCSIKEQVQDIIDNGQMDEDARLFFSNNNCLTMKDIAELITWFDLKKDYDFSDNNVVFVPKQYILSMAKDNQKL